MDEDKELIVNPNLSLEVLSQDFIVARVNKLKEIKEEIMDEGVHYGLIPGCGKKPTILKEGSELLCMAFQLCPHYDITINNLPGNHREYEFEGYITYIPTGAVIAHGVGMCSTMESKYRYRDSKRCCPQCKQEAIIKGRQEYGGGWLCFAKKGGCGAKFSDGDQSIEGQVIGQIENPDIADQYNTVKKMGKKRCQSDLVLTATGASFLFTQDMDDNNDDNKNPPPPPLPPKPSMTPPQSKSETEETEWKSGGITKRQNTAIFACFRAVMNETNEDTIKEHCASIADIEKPKSMKDLTFDQASQIISHLNSMKQSNETPY